MRDVLAMPVIVGRKNRQGAIRRCGKHDDCEGIMRDAKALQMGTSHELGQRFSRAFTITYASAEGSRELCWTTSSRDAAQIGVARLPWESIGGIRYFTGACPWLLDPLSIGDVSRWCYRQLRR